MEKEIFFCVAGFSPFESAKNGELILLHQMLVSVCLYVFECVSRYSGIFNWNIRGTNVNSIQATPGWLLNNLFTPTSSFEWILEEVIFWFSHPRSL